MNLLTIVAAAFTVIGALGGIGGAWALFRANLAQSTIQLQGENITALKDRLDEVMQTAAEKDEVIKIQDGRITKQGDEIVVLRNMVQGVTAIQRLTEKIDRNHKELIDAIRAPK